MTSLHVRAVDAPTRHPTFAGRWVEVDRVVLQGGATREFRAPARDECVAVLVNGDITWNGTSAQRSSPFHERAHAVYMAPGSALRVEASSDSELIVATSRFDDVPSGGDAVVLQPRDVAVERRGRGIWERDVHDVCVGQVPARHLIVGETFNIAGGWSSFPPHKHDGGDGEPALEEVYSFRFDPPDGFGFQAVDRPGDPAAFLIRDRDTVAIPSGYHPVCAAPGYRLYYCWVLAGPVRRLEMVEDVRYSWLHDAG